MSTSGISFGPRSRRVIQWPGNLGARVRSRAGVTSSLATTSLRRRTQALILVSTSSLLSAAVPSAVALLLAYPFLLLPAVLDAHRRASGIPETSSSGASRSHVVTMLLVIGPLAIPQLWQSQGFSRRAKILWTCIISVVSLIVILLMVAIGPGLEHWIERSFEPVLSW